MLGLFGLQSRWIQRLQRDDCTVYIWGPLIARLPNQLRKASGDPARTTNRSTVDNLGDAERNAFSTPPAKNVNKYDTHAEIVSDVWDSDLTNTKLFTYVFSEFQTNTKHLMPWKNAPASRLPHIRKLNMVPLQRPGRPYGVPTWGGLRDQLGVL